MDKVKNNLKSLYEQRQKFIEESNYIKAEETTQKINEYKNSVLEQHKREFNKRRQIDQDTFEKNYSEELAQFNERWAKREEELKSFLDQKEKELIKNQKEQMNYYLNGSAERNMKQKISPNYLNMKKVEMTLVKQERFLEAEQMKQKAEKLLKEENRLMEIQNQKKIKNQIEMLRKRQKEELAKFKDDKDKQIYMIQREKNREYDMIVNKYRTIRVEMMLRQKDDETRDKEILKKTFRSGKRSMSQDIRSPYTNSNYFKQ
jgi:hypothetical protein